MHSLAEINAPIYQDPWSGTIATRLAMLRRGRFRIAYFYEKPDNSTFRYRVYNPVQVLNELGTDNDLSASYFYLSDLPSLDDIVSLADMAVVCRTRYCSQVDTFISAFRHAGKRVLFDIDDLVFDPDHAALVAETIAHSMKTQDSWDAWYGYVSRLGTTLRMCDGAITTNDYLANRIESFSGKPTRVMPNFMNREQMALSEQVYQAKRARGFRGDGQIHFGYFSGTPSHARDFAIARPALEQLLIEHPNAHLVVAGYISVNHIADAIKARVHYEPFRDFVQLQKLVGSVEFNLVPLQINSFTHCKSELKYFEAAAVGTVSIASPTQMYTKVIEHAVNGFVCPAHAWDERLATAMSIPAGTYASLAAKAHAHATTHYAWDHQLDTIKAALLIS